MPKSKTSTGEKEQLVELVPEHPHLYNPRLPEHRDTQLNFIFLLFGVNKVLVLVLVLMHGAHW